MGIRRKRWFLLLWVLLLGPILLYGGIVSPLGMALVRSIVQSQINRRINGTLSIGRIRSNLFNWITLEQVQLKIDGAATTIEIASTRTLKVQYNPFGLVRRDGVSWKIAVEQPLLRIQIRATHASSLPADSTVAVTETARPSSLQIPIPEQVRITGGTFEYVDERQGLSITLDDLELYEARPTGARWATGDLRIGAATVHADAYRDTSIALQAAFQIAPDSLRISDLRLYAAHTSLKGRGEIAFIPQPTLHLTTESETDLTAALRVFVPLHSDSVRPPKSEIRNPKSEIHVGGTLHLRMTADGPVEAPILSADVRLRSLQTDWGGLDSLSGVLRMEGKHVDVTDLSASVAGGYVVGRGKWDQEGDRWTYALNAMLKDVDLGQIADLGKRGMGGRISGGLSLQGNTGGLPAIVASLTGRLQLASEELAIAGQEIGSAEINMDYKAGAADFSIKALGIKAEGTGPVQVDERPAPSGGAPLTGHLSVNVEAPHLRPLSGLTGVDLTGAGVIRATVQGNLSNPSVRLGFQGDEVVMAQAALGQVSGEVGYAPGGALQVRLSAHGGHTRIAGTMDVRRKRLGPMVLSVDSLNVPAMFPLLREAQVEGWMEAGGTLTGSFDHPRFDGTWRTQGVRWRGEPLVGIEGQMELRDAWLQWALTTTPSASKPLGRRVEEQGVGGSVPPPLPVARDSVSALSARGRLHLAEPFPFETTVIAQGLDLTPLLNALNMGRQGPTQGLLSGSMAAQGTIQDLRAMEATLTLDTLSVTVNNRELHSLRGGRIYLAQGRMFTDDVNLTGEAGTVHIGGYIGLSGEQQFRVEIQNGHLSALFPGTMSSDEVPDGLLNGHLSITGSASSPKIYGELQATDFTLRPFQGDGITLQMDYTEGSLLLSGWWGQPRGGQIQMDLAIPVDLSFEPVPHERLGRPFRLSATAKAFDLRGLWIVFPEAVSDFGGTVSADLVFEGDPSDPLRAEGALIVETVTLFANGGIWANLEPIRMALGGGTAKVRSFETVFAREWGLQQAGEGTLRCSGQLSLTSDSDLHIVARNADMGLITGLFGLGDQVSGGLDAETVWTGPPDDPRVYVEAQAEGVRFDPLRFGPLKGVAFYERGRLSIHEATFSVGKGHLSVQGGIPMDLRLRREGPGRPMGHVEVTVVSQGLDLSLLKPLSSDIRALNGDVTVDLRLTGDKTAPRLQGSVHLTHGRLQFRNMASKISVEHLLLSSHGDTVRISTTGGKAGKGTWGLQGMVDFPSSPIPKSEVRNPKWEVGWWARDARVHMPKIVDLTIQGDLTWSGEPAASVLSGEVWIRKGTVNRSLNIGALLPFAERIRRPPTEPSPLLRGLSLALRVQTESPLKVQNDLANLPVEAHLDMGGTVLRPALTGDIRAEKGKIYYLDRAFDLDRFSLLFADPYRMDPEMDIAAHTEMMDDQGQAYSIELDLSGTAFHPILELRGSSTLSDIPLSQPNIISLLTLGTTTEQLLFGADQRLLSRTKELASRQLLGLTSREIEQLLNIDQVYIEANLFDPSTLADARIRVDKRVAKRLKVSYSTVIGHLGEEQIEVDYRLTDHLSVQTQADRKGNSGIDLTLRMRFP